MTLSNAADARAASTAGTPRVIVVPGPDDVAARAAELLCNTLRDAIERRGEAHLVLTGGSSAAPLYERLVSREWRDRVDWRNVHLWLGDERYVPTEHPDSNARLVEQLLLAMAARMGLSGEGGQGSDIAAGAVAGLPVPSEHVHLFPVNEAIGRGAHEQQWAAEQYALAIRDFTPHGAAGLPAFDVVLLGMGPDGHIMSVFPDSPALDDDAPLVLAVDAPQHIGPHLPRLTMNPRVLRAAYLVILMVSGAGKAETLARVFGDDYDPRRWPAQLARSSNATWLLDEGAAGRLPGNAVTER